MNYKKKEKRFLVTECEARHPKLSSLFPTCLILFQEHMTETQRAKAGSPMVGASISREARQEDVANLVPDACSLESHRLFPAAHFSLNNQG